MSVDWSEVYRTTYASIVRFIHRQVWDEDRAHDLAQEAFVRSLPHEPENPRAWVFRIASNLVRDEAKMVVRRKKHLALLRTEQEAVAPAPAEPDAELDRKEREERVRRALAALTDRDREVLLLWDAGLGYAEIAAQTGLAPGAVGTTLSRARKKLVASYDALEETDAARG
ncbi:MAG TPA: sigma-70 family RNA polymerase sigma factor [Longimicrobiales bacterium]|nr:sigma-70 family RNA polymerase sigma factor [Longimicrobiales bacterium]